MKISLLFILVCLSGCTSRTKTATDCKEDFDSFFEKFASDSIFQKKHVEFPLMEYYTDEDFPLDMMETMTEEESFAFLSFDGKDKSNPYEISIDKKADSVFCQKKGINNPVDIRYSFVCSKDSWFLVEITDRTD